MWHKLLLKGAALKLQQLEQKLCKKSTLESKDPLDDSSPVLAPDWDKDRESEKEKEADRSSKNSETCEEKTSDIRTLQHGELSKVRYWLCMLYFPCTYPYFPFIPKVHIP